MRGDPLLQNRWVFLVVGLLVGGIIGLRLGNPAVGAGLGLCVGSAAAGVLSIKNSRP